VVVFEPVLCSLPSDFRKAKGALHETGRAEFLGVLGF